jgi:predicted DNA-binding protein
MKVVSTKLTDEEFQALYEKARKDGSSVSDLVRKAILAYLNLPAQNRMDVSDRLFALERHVSELEKRIVALERAVFRQAGASQPQATEQSSKSRKTAWDILEEEEIVCVSTMTKARDPHKIIDILKSNGAVILSSENDKCAVHPDTWTSFVEALTKINSPDEREVLSKLKGKAKQLFKMLRAMGAVHFNSKTKTWIVDTSAVEKGEKAPGLKEVKESEEKAGSQYVVRIPIEEVGDTESYMTDMERSGWLCNEASRSIICVWRELLEQVVVDLNNSKAGVNDLEKVLAGDKDKLEVAKASYEAGLMWYDNKEKRWRAPL